MSGPTVGAPELENADPAAFKKLPSARAYRLNAMPFAIDKKTIRVAFADPSNIAAIDEVAAVTGCRVIPAVASEVRLMEAHQKHYGRVLSRHFVSILKRLATPPDAVLERPQVPVPPPPPRFLDFSAPPSETELQAEMPSLASASADESGATEPVESAGSEAAPVFMNEAEAAPESDDAPAPAPVGESAPEQLGESTIAVKGQAATDRYSDEYSLTEFLTEALEGVSLEDLWQAGGFDEELPLDLGEPLAEPEDPEMTRPSRRGGPPRHNPEDARWDASA